MAARSLLFSFFVECVQLILNRSSGAQTPEPDEYPEHSKAGGRRDREPDIHPAHVQREWHSSNPTEKERDQRKTDQEKDDSGACTVRGEQTSPSPNVQTVSFSFEFISVRIPRNRKGGIFLGDFAESGLVPRESMDQNGDQKQT